MTESSRRIAVACAADAAFARPLAAMGVSLIDNLAAGREVDLYVVDTGLGGANRARLERSWSGAPVAAHWIRADLAALPDLPLWGRMAPETYLRLLMTDLLPATLDRVIWLDCDLLVAADLGTLWDLPMDGATVLAVQDLVVPFVGSPLGVAAYRDLGLPPDAPHFNAGVMVVHLGLWRREGVGRRALDYLRRCREATVFWDQEGLNAALVGRWGRLDPRWNQIETVAGRRFFRPRHLPPDEYRRVVEEPLIVHFAGSIKPWLHHVPTPGRTLFFRYLDATAWAGWRPRRTARTLLLSLYEARLRRYLYPLEWPALRLLRRLRRSTTDSALAARDDDRLAQPVTRR